MNKEEKMLFIANQLYSLSKITELHKQLKDINISLANLYPVAIVKEDNFYVFDLDETGKKYEFKLEYPTPMHIADEVLASFPLEFYDMKSAAIISEKAFHSLEGYVFIFHEFVHCFQWENGEKEIRKTLELERKAKENNDYMWEITYSFPYENAAFIKKTKALDDLFKARDLAGVVLYHKELRDCLQKTDFEYMLWQEWKEGFARYVENLIRDRLRIKRNTNRLLPPFNRVCFYEIGSNYIDLLLETDMGLRYRISDLYFRM